MKKSVLFALLGISTTEALKITEKEADAKSDTQSSYELIQAMVDLEAKQDEFDHQ